MRIDVFTIFPDVVSGYCGTSILGRAADAGALDVRVHDLRDGADDARRSVDDSPFGGGAGMVLIPDPIFRCVEAVPDLPRPLFLLAPGGRPVRPGRGGRAGGRTAPAGFSLLCGRYEGVDQRVADHLVDGELSVGDFVLAGGELAALVVVEAVARLLPDVLGQRGVRPGRELLRGAARVPPVHPAGGVQGLAGPRGAPVGGPRGGGRLAPLAGAAADGRAPPRPDCAPGQGLGAQCQRRAGPRPSTATMFRPALSRCDRRTPLMHPTETIDRDSLRDDIPEFRPGDTVKVHVRVVEGNRERVQVFQGAVMRRQGGGVQETFTVRKVSFGVGVERTFPVHSPTIAKIEVTTLGDVRRAKLYYLRDRHGKAAKIKERRIPRGKAAAEAVVEDEIEDDVEEIEEVDAVDAIEDVDVVDEVEAGDAEVDEAVEEDADE